MLEEINLLPWRKAHYFLQQKIQRMIIIIGSSVLCSITLIAILVINHQMKLTLQQQQDLTKQAIVLDLLLQKQQEAEQTNIFIAAISTQQQQLMTVLTAIENCLPTNLTLTDIRREKHSLQLAGQTNNMVSLKQFIHALKTNTKLQHVDIVDIQHIPASPAINFHLSLLEIS